MDHIKNDIGIYETELGASCNLKIGALNITMQGFENQEEAQEAIESILLALAKRRGVLPRALADRTGPEMIKRLRSEG
jgi:hypothetical protein